MNRMAQASMATPIPAEQSLSSIFLVEVMHDLDDGQPMLLLSTDANQGDLQVAAADQIISKAAEQHQAIDKGVRLALDFEAATTPRVTEPPRTWSFIDSDTGQLRTVTCMPGCNITHEADIDTVGPPEDVSCSAYDRANETELLVACGDREDAAPVLSTLIQVDHFAPDPAHRVPHAVVEVIGEHYTDPLDPDELQAVIELFEQRTAAMRIRHAELVRIRAEHAGRRA